MNHLSMSFVAVTALLVVPGFAEAQRTQSKYTFFAVGTNGLGQLGLLQQRSVQEELRLTRKQLDSVEELLASQERWFRESAGGNLAEQQKRRDARSTELESEIGDLLTPKQVQRLKQIGLQQQGAWALADPKIADTLELTAEQKEHVKSIATAARFKMRGFGRPGGPPNRENTESARQAASEELLGVLTEEQQSRWKELLGAPFTGEIKRP